MSKIIFVINIDGIEFNIIQMFSSVCFRRKNNLFSNMMIYKIEIEDGRIFQADIDELGGLANEILELKTYLPQYRKVLEKYNKLINLI